MTAGCGLEVLGLDSGEESISWIHAWQVRGCKVITIPQVTNLVAASPWRSQVQSPPTQPLQDLGRGLHHHRHPRSLSVSVPALGHLALSESLLYCPLPGTRPSHGPLARLTTRLWVSFQSCGSLCVSVPSWSAYPGSRP